MPVQAEHLLRLSKEPVMNIEASTTVRLVCISFLSTNPGHWLRPLFAPPFCPRKSGAVNRLGRTSMDNPHRVMVRCL